MSKCYLCARAVPIIAVSAQNVWTACHSTRMQCREVLLLVWILLHVLVVPAVARFAVRLFRSMPVFGSLISPQVHTNIIIIVYVCTAHMLVHVYSTLYIRHLPFLLWQMSFSALSALGASKARPACAVTMLQLYDESQRVKRAHMNIVLGWY